MTSKQPNDRAAPCVRGVYAACRGKASVSLEKRFASEPQSLGAFSSQRRFHGKFRAERHCGRSWLPRVHVYECARVYARAYVVQSLRWLIVERNLRACVLLDHSMNETSVKGSGSNVTFSNYSSSSNKFPSRFLLDLINLASSRPI